MTLSTQNNDPAENSEERRLANLKPFPKGVSGNPGGRSKGLQRRVRELCGDDGETIAVFLLDVLNDTNEKTGERLEAAKILLERGWGRPAITVSDGDSPTSFVLLSAFAVAPDGTVEEAA